MSAPPGAARILAVANQKGGVGKSTTVVNLGAWLALRGSKVLLVDLDPQANATTGVGVDSRIASGNVYRMLVEDLPVDDAIEATSVRNLYVIPSTIDLAGAEIELVSSFSRELKLKKALQPIQEDFDFIFIDCPPSLGLLTVNALAAAHEVLVPIQCEFYALEGLGQLLKNVSLVQSSLNPDLRLSGIVLTMFDARTKLAEQVAQEVRTHFPGRVHAAVIPRSVRLSEAPSFGQPVALYDPKSQGSLAYERLAAEVEAAGANPTGGEKDSFRPGSSIPTENAAGSSPGPGPQPGESDNLAEGAQEPARGPLAGGEPPVPVEPGLPGEEVPQKISQEAAFSPAVTATGPPVQTQAGEETGGAGAPLSAPYGGQGAADPPPLKTSIETAASAPGQLTGLTGPQEGPGPGPAREDQGLPHAFPEPEEPGEKSQGGSE